MSNLSKLQEIISETKAANGRFKAKDLDIMVDNDQTLIYWEDERLFEGAGQYDVFELYEILFPGADVHAA